MSLASHNRIFDGWITIQRWLNSEYVDAIYCDCEKCVHRNWIDIKILEKVTFESKE